MANIEELINSRAIERQNKNYVACDNLRDYLDTHNVFVFDTKGGQEIFYLTESYFDKKPAGMTKRKYVEYIIQRDIRAEKNFNAWLFSQKEECDRLRHNTGVTP